MPNLTDKEEILSEIGKLRLEIQELRILIVGDRFKSQHGLIDVLETHRRELYGNEATQDIGLKKRSEGDHGRIRSLENDRIKIIAWALGASATVTFITGIVKMFWPK